MKITYNMTLLIAAPSFSQPSETFIRAHAKTIQPKRTVLVCQDGRGTEVLQLPVLANIDPYPAALTPFERLWMSARFRWRAQVDRAVKGVNEQRIREFMQQHEVTHCLAEFGPTGCALRRAARNAGVRMFVHFHGYDATSLPRQAAWRRHYTRLFKDVDGIIAPSRFILERLAHLGCPREKLHVSACGINPQHFPESRREKGQILAIGRFVEKKAPLTTIRAFAKTIDIVSDARLHMVGDGPMLAAAQELVAQSGLSDRVIFHGSQPHDIVRAMLGRVSLFVQHSVTASSGDTEGLPVAILEAMASGLPVVSTRHGGIPEVVQDGKTGFLVDEHDEVGMAEAMLRLLQDPEMAARMGQTGVPRIQEEFSHHATATRLRRIMGIVEYHGDC